MSCAVGLVHGGTVYIGVDSIAADLDNCGAEIRKDPKALIRGAFVLGFVGDFRRWQLLSFAFTPPRRRSERDPHAYLVTSFVRAMQACFKAGGLADDKDADFDLLVGTAGRLFRIEGNYVVAECSTGFDAIGGGGAAALGALYAQDLMLGAARRAKVELPYSPEQRVLDALAVSEKATPVVRRPFAVLSMPRKL